MNPAPYTMTDEYLLEVWQSFDGEDDRPEYQREVLKEIEKRELDL